MRVLIGCEFSGRMREAFRVRGHDAYSCDLRPTEIPGLHLQCDVREVLNDGWDLAIFHPVCTRLTNAGVRWLTVPPKGRTVAEMWDELREAALFYLSLRAAKIPRIAMENPVMHKHARALIQPGKRQWGKPLSFT